MSSTADNVPTTGSSSHRPDHVEQEFDRFAGEYDRIMEAGVAASGYHPDHFAELKIREIRRCLEKQGIADSPLRVLNFGCGIGRSERFIVRHLPRAEIFSIDVSRVSLEIAREENRELPQVRFAWTDGYHIPFDVTFDVILVAGVLHHISQPDRVKVLQGLQSSLADVGHLFLFEHNPYNPLTVKVVRECPLDKNVELILPREAGRLLAASGFVHRAPRFIIFFPRALSFFAPLERYLNKVPIGGQYYIIAGKF